MILLAVQIVITFIAIYKYCISALVSHFFETVQQQRFILRELAVYLVCTYVSNYIIFRSVTAGSSGE